MRRLIPLLAGVLLAGVGASHATSIFSPLGIGVWHRNETAYSAAVAGANVTVSDSVYFSLNNPASWRSHGLTRYTAGMVSDKTRAEDTSSDDVADNLWFPSAAIALPIYKSVGLGLMYQSLTDYDYLVFRRETYKIQEPIDTLAPYDVLKRIQGNGGLSRAGVRVAMSLSAAVHAGVGFDYYFGEIEQLTTLQFLQGSYLRSGRFVRHEFSGIGSSAGVTFAPDSATALAITARVPTVLTVSTHLTIEGGDSTNLADSEYELPLSVTLAGRRDFGRMRVMARGTMEMWEEATREIDRSQRYSNRIELGAGAERLPLRVPLVSGWEELTYRAGVRYLQEYVEAGGNPLETYGASLGCGIPIAGGRSMLDLAFWLDLRGSIDGNGARERIFGVQLSVSATERWFTRRSRRR
ncbi:MAG: hypothetical protein MAG453_01742 [Calditrichaeota bacterium]|nr:hypothetical protein [Calditrichota bacterium]